MFAPAFVAEYTPAVLNLVLALIPIEELLTMIEPLSPDFAIAGICVQNAKGSKLGKRKEH